jgi:hypothetical protein
MEKSEQKASANYARIDAALDRHSMAERRGLLSRLAQGKLTSPKKLTDLSAL